MRESGRLQTAGRFTFEEAFPVTQWIGVRVVAGNDFWKKRLISFPYQGSQSVSSVVQPHIYLFYRLQYSGFSEL